MDPLEVGHHSEIVDWIKESDLPVSEEVAEKALGSRKSTRVVPPTYAAPPKPMANKLTRPRAKKARPDVDAIVPWKGVAADCGGGAWHINCHRCEDESDSDSDGEYDLLHCYYCNLAVHSMCYRTTYPVLGATPVASRRVGLLSVHAGLPGGPLGQFLCIKPLRRVCLIYIISYICAPWPKAFLLGPVGPRKSLFLPILRLVN
jgi:hypothetical protein